MNQAKKQLDEACAEAENGANAGMENPDQAQAQTADQNQAAANSVPPEAPAEDPTPPAQSSVVEPATDSPIVQGAGVSASTAAAPTPAETNSGDLPLVARFEVRKQGSGYLVTSSNAEQDFPAFVASDLNEVVESLGAFFTEKATA